MPFVFNCIYECTKCKQNTISCINGDATRRVKAITEHKPTDTLQ